MNQSNKKSTKNANEVVRSQSFENYSNEPEENEQAKNQKISEK